MQPAPNILEQQASGSTPAHIAIIMDGNSRWAKANGKPVREGHRQGSQALKRLVENCRGQGIDYLTVYAFSSENWNRPEAEVSDLMELLRYYLRHEVKTLHKNGARIRFIGDRAALSDDIQSELTRAEELTQNNQEITLVIALSYGSRQELTRAMQAIARVGIAPEAITQEVIAQHLDTAGIPDPDLLIRTGGEQRISNYLLWQSAYAELYFTDTLWPDFTIEHLREAMDEFALRERRFGGR
jgi:undecaprenyl diphosphate synthase